MRKVMTSLCLLALAGACKQKTPDDKPASPGHSGAMGTGGDMGSAMRAMAPDGAVHAPAVDAAATRTADDLAKRYDECVRFASGGDWERYRGCYAADATFETPGLGEADAQGRFTRDRAFFDAKTIEGQIAGAKDVRPPPPEFPTKTAVISKDAPVEQANRATLEKLSAAYVARDVAAIGALLADTLVWSAQARPQDVDKAKVLASYEGMWKMVPDIRYDAVQSWTAGDYVATLERGSGTMPARGSAAARKLEIPLFAVHRLEHGTIVQAWVFFQRAASDAR